MEKMESRVVHTLEGFTLQLAKIVDINSVERSNDTFLKYLPDSHVLLVKRLDGKAIDIPRRPIKLSGEVYTRSDALVSGDDILVVEYWYGGREISFGLVNRETNTLARKLVCVSAKVKGSAMDMWKSVMYRVSQEAKNDLMAICHIRSSLYRKLMGTQ